MPHKRAKHSARVADRKSKGTDLPPTTSDVHMRDMPKNAMRIINAAKVQEEYNRKKKERAAAAASRTGIATGADVTDEKRAALQIQPGEKLSDFSRRVETSMASEVHAAFRHSRDTKKKRKRQPKDDDDRVRDEQTTAKSTDGGNDGDNDELSKRALKAERERLSNVGRDWQKASQRRSVRDVVQAPPSLTKAPRGQGEDALRRKAQLRALIEGEDGNSPSGDVSRSSKARIPDGVQQALGLRRKVELAEEREKAVKEYRRRKEAKLNSYV